MAGGDQFDTVRPGEKFRFYADAYNDLMRMRRDWRGGFQQGARAAAKSGLIANPAIILVSNPGINCPAFGVLALDNSPASIPIGPTVFLPGFQQSLILQGDVPAAGDDVLAFAVALESIPSGFVGRCAIAGAVQVQIQVTSETDGLLCAGPLPGDNTQLQLVPGGFKVLWIDEYDDSDDSDDTQTLWGIVNLGVPEGMLQARMDASQDGTHPAGQTRVYDLLSTPYATANPAVQVEVYNAIKDVAVDARDEVALIQGIQGQYNLVAINPCGSGM